MKKRLLFIAGELNTNGSTLALLPLMENLVDNGYDVSLFLSSHGGEWLDKIDKRVKLLPEIAALKIIAMPLGASLRWSIRSGHFLYGALRLILTIGQRIGLRCDKYSALRFMPNVSGRYDCAIGFTVGYDWWVVANRVNAKARVAWVDNDISGIQVAWMRFMDVDRLTALVFESESSRTDFNTRYPHKAKDSFVVHNTVNPQKLESMAAAAAVPAKERFRIVTIGRPSKQKGTELIPLIADMLRDLDFEWFVLGGGPSTARHIELVKSRGVSDKVFFIGDQMNPFGYLESSDLYVQPSRFEGWGTSLTEAMSMGKYVVASNIPQFREQVLSDDEGVLCAVDDVMAFADAIRKAINRPTAECALSRTLPNEPQNVLKEFGHMIDVVLREVT